VVNLIKQVKWFDTKFNISSNEQGVYGHDFWITKYEESQAALFMRYLNRFPEAVFIDLGAGIGAYTLPALVKNQKVIAFEPENNTYQVLKENISANRFDQDFQIINAAIVSDIDSQRKFGGDARNQHVHNFSQEEVDFSTVLSQNSKALIKIDIEGAEWPLMQSKKIINLLRTGEYTIIFAPHIGFHSDKRNSSYRRLIEFRIGVIRELVTLLSISLKFKFAYELDKGTFTPFSVFKKNMFSSIGWPNSLILSNNPKQIFAIKQMIGFS
jgi:FkbM family methyltransferase